MSRQPLGIMLLPGMDGTGRLLAELQRELAASGPVLVSPYPNDRPMTFEQHVAHVLNGMPHEPFILVGESFSGPVAIAAAARAPGRVAGLALVATFARHPLPAALAPLAGLLSLKALPASVIARILMGRWANRDRRAELKAVLNAVPAAVLRRRQALAIATDQRAAVKSYPGLLAYIQGRRDRVAPRSALDEIKRLRPDCQTHRIDGPHMLLHTHTKQAAEVLVKFADEVAARI